MNRHHLLFISSAVAIVIVAAVVYLFGTPAPDAGESAASSASLATNSSDRTSRTEDRLAPRTLAGREQQFVGSEAVPQHAVEQVEPEKYASAPQQPWEKEIISLVNRLDVSDMDKAHRLLSRIPALSPEAKVVAMEYATKLIPDEKYLEQRGRIFQLISSPELRETVTLDVLTRGESVRMPTLVEMLRQPNNPAQEEVREILVAYLEKDFGNDTRQWEAAVNEFLKENADL